VLQNDFNYRPNLYNLSALSGPNSIQSAYSDIP